MEIYENTAAASWNTDSVTTSQGIIKARKVILAIESSLSEIDPGQGNIFREQAIVTEPLSDQDLASLDWQKGSMLWTANEDYYNIRKIGTRLFISYDIDLHPDAAVKDAQEELMISLILKSFPTLKRERVRVSHRWNGLLLYTGRSRPYIGERGGVYYAFGHGGNGLTNGTMAGKLVAELISGKDVPELYRFD